MATVKIKFRPSSVDGREGTVYYQVIHGRVARQINTSCKLFPAEWSKRHSRIVIASSDEDRRQYLLLLDKKIAEDTDRLENVITALERKGGTFTADDVTSAFYDGHCGLSFSVFMREVTNGLKRLGKIRTSETYTSTLNSFMRFMEGRDIPPCDMDSDLMIAYEAWLKSGGVSMNTISFYMRNLRAVYNRAVEKELVIQRFPFRHVYTGVERTTKRAVPLRAIKQLMTLDLSTSSGQEVCKGHAASQFLHKGDVHDRYGVPEKEGSQQRHPLIPAEKNRSTTFCKMGAVHAGDRGPLQYSRLPIPSSHYRQTGHGREKAIYQRIPSYQQIFESHWERTRPVRPPDPLRRAPFLGQCGPE